MRRVTLGAVLAFLVGFSAFGAAQERMLLYSGQSLTEIGTAPGELGVVKAVLGPRPDLVSDDIVPLAGGRYVAGIQRFGGGGFESLRHLFVIDLRSGQVEHTSLRFDERDEIVAADPRLPRVYARRGNRLAVVDPLSQSVTDLNYEISEQLLPARGIVRYPNDSPVLIFSRGNAIDVIDLTTGAVSQTIPHAIAGASIAVDEAGRRIYVANSASSIGPTGVFAFDLATGALVARHVTTLSASVTRLMLDEPRQRVIAYAGVCGFCPPGAGDPVLVLNMSTLALESTVPQAALTGLGDMGGLEHNQLRLEPNARADALYVSVSRVRDLRVFGLECLHHSLRRLDASTGALNESADLRPLTACTGQLIQVQAPASPVLLAQVHGRQVTLSWTNPGNTLHFDVEAGSAAELRNLLVTSVNGNAFVADAVPSGTYYVRIRAINEIGRSLPSNEVRVVVP